MREALQLADCPGCVVYRFVGDALRPSDTLFPFPARHFFLSFSGYSLRSRSGPPGYPDNKRPSEYERKAFATGEAEHGHRRLLQRSRDTITVILLQL